MFATLKENANMFVKMKIGELRAEVLLNSLSVRNAGGGSTYEYYHLKY